MTKSTAMLLSLAAWLAAGPRAWTAPQNQATYEAEIFGGAGFGSKRTCATPATAG